MKKEILIIGPNPNNPNINHAGGQLTAITNLMKYIHKNRISYDIIDTFRSSFPPLSTKEKLIDSWHKYKLFKQKIKEYDYKGAVLFASYGFGYWEKLLYALTLEKKGIKSLFFIRSGHFMQSVIDKNYNVPIKSFLMNRLSYIGHQGGNWIDFYKKLGIKEEKLVKILNWIEIKEHQPTKHNSKVTFLYVGWIVKEKGVNELIEVILNNRSLDNFNFIFIGGGTLLENLKSSVKEQNAKNIVFKGWLDNKDVLPYYDKVDALILPSHAEGFPNVILEALNHRLPIIATDVGAICESVINNKNGFLIPPKDKEKLLESILALGESQTLREKFSKESEKIVIKNHSIEKNCQKIFNLFQGYR